jgi:hypothetical protein
LHRTGRKYPILGHAAKQLDVNSKDADAAVIDTAKQLS